MKSVKARMVLMGACLALGAPLVAAELTDIRNYIEYSPTLSSAGQPSKEQLALLPEAGFEQVVYIAFSNSGDAIADEDAIVKELGMDYVQIPVIWDAPTASDFYTFAGVMQRETERKTFLHCQANYRASAFSLLYRVLYEEVPLATAKADMNKIWMPNENWTDFILTVLEENEISPNCEGCEWAVAQQ